MPEAEFENYKKALVVQKLEKNKSLKEETAVNRLEVHHPYTHKFDRGNYNFHFKFKNLIFL